MRLVDPKDYVEINRWRLIREIPIVHPSLFPPVGLIEEKIAAGFINFTQTSMALLDLFTSNPEWDKQERETALLKIREHLEKMAYDEGVRFILAVTSHPKVKDYYMKTWKKIPCEVFGKELHGSR